MQATGLSASPQSTNMMTTLESSNSNTEATSNRYTPENGNTSLASPITDLSAREITATETSRRRRDLDQLTGYVRNNNVSKIIHFHDTINLKDCIDDEGTTTLIMLAIELGRTDIVRELLNRDAGHRVREKYMDLTGIQKLLNIALANADGEIVILLISHPIKCFRTIPRNIAFNYSDPTLICRIIDSQITNEHKTWALARLSVIHGQKELSPMEKILFESIYPKLAEYIPTIYYPEVFNSLSEIFIQLEPDYKVLAQHNASSNLELIQNTIKANNIPEGDSIAASAM